MQTATEVTICNVDISDDHIDTVHVDDNNNIDHNNNKIESDNKCEICNKHFSSRSHLNKHQKEIMTIMN